MKGESRDAIEKELEGFPLHPYYEARGYIFI